MKLLLIFFFFNSLILLAETTKEKIASLESECSKFPILFAKASELLMRDNLKAAKILRGEIIKNCNPLDYMMSLNNLRKEELAKNFPEVSKLEIENKSKNSGHPFPYGLLLMKMKKYDEVIPSLILESTFLSMNAQSVLFNIYLWGINGGPSKYDKRILSFYKEMANEGHPRFQYNLGVIYAEGLGENKNISIAERWFNLSSLPEAKIDLGNIYLNVKNDSTKAEKIWLSVVNEQSLAAYNLGVLYKDQKKYDQALKYFNIRLENVPNDSDAIVSLGQMYLEGWGNTMDCEKGKQNYLRAAYELENQLAKSALINFQSMSSQKKFKCFKK